VYANQVRDWVLANHPDFPVVAGQERFPIVVNRSGGDCPGNAWYDYSSLNFCVAGVREFVDPETGAVFTREYANSTVSSIVYHEYG
jgi:hypothetical protein